MKSLCNLLLMLLAIAVLGQGCSDGDTPGGDAAKAESSEPTVAEIANSYQKLTLMTPEDVYVNPEFAMLCVGVSKAAVETAEAEKGPHANCVVKIFMNDLAKTAFKNESSYPAGSVIVKQKYRLGYRVEGETQLQGTGDGVGGMIKRPAGYDVENGDWEYFYFEKTDSIESGQIKSCVDCHAEARGTDFVFGHWANQKQQD